MNFDAEGREGEEHCPKCGSLDTISYDYVEGFSELECRHCGYSSEFETLGDLARYAGDLKEGRQSELPPFPVKKLQA